jgi:ribosomal protein S27E
MAKVAGILGRNSRFLSDRFPDGNFMDKFGVPCPQCGSVRVVVGSKEELPSTSRPEGDDTAHVPLIYRCSCEDCRHRFHHDFAFGG